MLTIDIRRHERTSHRRTRLRLSANVERTRLRLSAQVKPTRSLHIRDPRQKKLREQGVAYELRPQKDLRQQKVRLQHAQTTFVGCGCP